MPKVLWQRADGTYKVPVPIGDVVELEMEKAYAKIALYDLIDAYESGSMSPDQFYARFKERVRPSLQRAEDISDRLRSQK